MNNVVADLCLEAEAQTLTALYFSAVFDAASLNYALPTHAPGGHAIGTSNEADMMELFRIGVAVGKYWVTKVRWVSFRLRWSIISRGCCPVI